MRNLLLSLFALSALTACQQGIEGNGSPARETREAAPFESIEISGPFEVVLTPSNYSALTIEADSNLLAHIESYVKGGTLKIEAQKEFSTYRKLRLEISTKDLKGLEASGAADIKSEGRITSESFNLEVSGASEAFLELDVGRFSADLSGATELNLRGNASEAKMKSSGASKIRAGKFKTRNLKLRMSGAGDAEVYTTGRLEVDISGAGKVRYRGNPEDVKQKISGAASVQPIQ